MAFYQMSCFPLGPPKYVSSPHLFEQYTTECKSQHARRHNLKFTDNSVILSLLDSNKLDRSPVCIWFYWVPPIILPHSQRGRDKRNICYIFVPCYHEQLGSQGSKKMIHIFVPQMTTNSALNLVLMQLMWGPISMCIFTQTCLLARFIVH